MAEEKIETLPVAEEKKPLAKAGRGGKKGRSQAKGRSKGKAKAKAQKAALRAEKKTAKKAAAEAEPKKGRKRGRKAKGKAGKKAAAPASAKLLVPESGDTQPIWYQYAIRPQAPVTKRPSIPTEVKTGNVVAWLTDSGRDRCGVVRGFQDDAALIDVGDRIESIRLSRLQVVAEKEEKEKKGKQGTK